MGKLTRKFATCLIAIAMIIGMFPTMLFAADGDKGWKIESRFLAGNHLVVYGEVDLDTVDFGTFKEFEITSTGVITGGSTSCKCINEGKINGGVFNGEVENEGTISDGTFNGSVQNKGTISGGTFNGSVQNGTKLFGSGTISGGTFNSTVINNEKINGGVFNGEVENNELISAGTFNAKVKNDNIISGGNFYEDVDNSALRGVTGGIFFKRITGGYLLVSGAKYAVVVSASPAEGGIAKINGSATSFDNNARVTIVATPNAGYEFVRWTEYGASVSTNASYSFNIDKSGRNLVAVFEKVNNSITVIDDGNGKAWADVDSAKIGDTVHLTAIANIGYQSGDWEVISGQVTIDRDTQTFIMGDSPVQLKAIFKSVFNDVTVENVTGGTCSVNKTSALCGDTIIATGTAEYGYQFVGIIVNETIIEKGDSDDISFIMPDEKVVVTPIFEHVHTWSEDWSYDNDNHWFECTLPGCSERKDVGEHVYRGVEDLTCDACGYSRKAYTIIIGADQEIKKGEEALFVSDAEFDIFVMVVVDGMKVDSSCYVAEAGSTRITLDEEYTDSLDEGEHTFSIISEDGVASTSFTTVSNDAGTVIVDPADEPTVTPTVTPTPVVTPDVTPVVTPTTTPAVTPDVTPIVTPEPTPVVTPVVTPTTTPVVTPDVTPVVTPEPTPVVTPVVTPTTTPVVTPDVTPVVTPEPTPVVTPVVTPTTTPVVTPDVTPIVTPEPTPVVTPADIPVVTPEVVVVIPDVTPVDAPLSEPTASVEPSAGDAQTGVVGNEQAVDANKDSAAPASVQNVARTGETTNIYVWISIAIVAVGALVIAICVKKSSRDKTDS